MNPNNTTKHIIDAADKKIGRIASDAAACLMGKKDVSFAKNTVAHVQVEIINANRAYVASKKKVGGKGDDYVRYTGFRGGLKSEKLSELIERRGMSEVFKLSVYNMLPKNKLRSLRLKNLIIKE